MAKWPGSKEWQHLPPSSRPKYVPPSTRELIRRKQVDKPKPEFTPAHYMAAGLSVAAAHVAAQAAKRQALVEEHRASEHLFKPREGEAAAKIVVTKVVGGRGYEAKVGKYTVWGATREHARIAAERTAEKVAGGKLFLASEVERRQMEAEGGLKLKDPQAEQLARLKGARAEKSILTGPRGGRHYISSTGQKVYVGPE